MTSRGEPVRYIRSTFVPQTGQCMCLFEAQDAEQVRAVNRQADIPFDKVTEALDLTPCCNTRQLATSTPAIR